MSRAARAPTPLRHDAVPVTVRAARPPSRADGAGRVGRRAAGQAVSKPVPPCNGASEPPVAVVDTPWWQAKLPRLNTFDQLSDATRAALAGIGQVRSWRDGEVLQHAGVPAPALLLVQRGRLRLSAISASGAEVLWPVVGPGKLVCLYAAVSGLPFHYTTTACGDCGVVHFPCGPLLALMERDAPVACDIARLLAKRFWGLMDGRVEGQQSSVAYRVYTALQYMAAQRGVARPHGMEVRVSQQELAAMVGSSRPHLNTCLRQLQQDGRIEIGYRSILLCERADPRG